MYLEEELTTISAPCFSPWKRYAVAVVLSRISGILCACAISASLSTSVTSRQGLPIVSAKSRRVCSLMAPSNRFPVIVFYIPGFDTKFLDITKQIDGSSVKTCRRDHLIPLRTIFKMDIHDRRHTGSTGDRSHAAFQFCDSVFKCGYCRVPTRV